MNTWTTFTLATVIAEGVDKREIRFLTLHRTCLNVRMVLRRLPDYVKLAKSLPDLMITF